MVLAYCMGIRIRLRKGTRPVSQELDSADGAVTTHRDGADPASHARPRRHGVTR